MTKRPRLIDPAAEDNRPKVRVAICVPCGDEVSAGFAYDLARLTAFTTATSRIGLHLVFDRGSVLPRQRRELVHSAFAADCTHILFVDSDMRFPKDALLRLLAHTEPVVACNYPRRSHPVVPTAMLSPTEPLYESVQHLTPVPVAGMGFMLIDLDTFRGVPEPWFAMPALDDGTIIGEDVFFCDALHAGGVPVLIDTVLSLAVSHIGEFEFTHDHALAYRESGSSETASDGA